jgi:hypothetical protein
MSPAEELLDILDQLGGFGTHPVDLFPSRVSFAALTLFRNSPLAVANLPPSTFGRQFGKLVARLREISKALRFPSYDGARQLIVGCAHICARVTH